MPNIQAMYNTITARASARNRFADLLTLFENHNNKAKFSPTNIDPRKARSYKSIWKVYGFKY